MKTKCTLSVLLFLLSFSITAQVYNVKDAVEFFHSNELSRGEWKPVLTADDVSGSPYLNEEFANGTVYTTSKVQYNGLPLRYNAYNDQVEFKNNEDEIQAIAVPESIEKIEFNNIEMVYSPYTNAKKIKRGYFIVMEEGEASLYQKPHIIFEQAKEAAPYKDPEPPKFVKKTDYYYIKVGNSEAKNIASKKDLVAVFPDHQKQVEKFVKKNKVKPNKPERMVKLVKFYNQL
ncbi:MAG TPA: hypothetical protein VKA10_00040 [Prolixibacteraceae bacterium]|nr:hypothetical protein [Prolixibacteraceae bacterium]